MLVDALGDYQKLERYTIFQYGYVLNLGSVKYDIPDYVAVKAHVKPRTNDKNPVTELKFYNCWIIMKKSPVSIHSAYCACKGGFLSPRPKYCPLPKDAAKSDTDELLNKLKYLCPDACILRSKFVNLNKKPINLKKPLNVIAPMQKFLREICIADPCYCGNIFIYYHLAYTPEES